MSNLKSIAKTQLSKLPLIKYWKKKCEFRIEKALIAKKSIPTSNATSVIHYSVNKAATQYTKRIVLRCGQENELIPVRMSDYAWISNFPYLFTLSKKQVKPYLNIFRPNGFLYTVFGGVVEDIPNLSNYKVLIMVRDPRDMLVSAFYSYSKSHAAPKDPDKAKSFYELRKKMGSMTVDEYALDMVDNTKWRLNQYLDLKKDNDNICILKYEDMIENFESWLNILLDHCDWKISNSLRQELLTEAKASTNVKEETQLSHRRQVTPGDHRRKLDDKTILKLNDQLSDVLNKYGYL